MSHTGGRVSRSRMLDTMRVIAIALLLTACSEAPAPPAPRPSAPAVAPPAPTPPSCPADAEGVRVTDEALTLNAAISFDLYAGTVAPESLPGIDAVARRLAACADLEAIEIQVHTDSMRMGAFNAQRSQVIADALRQRLIDDGVGATRVIACGYGESRPVAPNTTAEGRAQNMRVEWRRVAPSYACPMIAE